MPAPQSSNWCFTLYNYETFDFWKNITLPDGLKFIAWGEEVCPTTKRPHLQGYAVTLKKITMSSIQKIFKASWRVMRGRFDENESYCSKESSLTTLGVKPMDRNDQAKDQKKRYEDALAAAAVGDFESIPADLFTRYRTTYKRHHEEMSAKIKLPDLCYKSKVNLWI